MTETEIFANEEAIKLMKKFSFYGAIDYMELRKNGDIQRAMAEAFLSGAICAGMDSDVFRGAMKHFQEKENEN